MLLGSDVDVSAVRDRAQRIKDGQKRENVQMRAWADERSIQKDRELHSTHIVNGMFLPGQLDEFATLRGDEVARGGYTPLKEMEDLLGYTPN